MLLIPLPLSQTVTLSRTPSPSSVTYFMDGPYVKIISSPHGPKMPSPNFCCGASAPPG